VKEESPVWIVVFTGVLTAFTIVLAYVGWEANKNNVVSQRAFVNFHALQMVDR